MEQKRAGMSATISCVVAEGKAYGRLAGPRVDVGT